MCKRVITLLLIPFLLFYVQPTQAAEKEEQSWQDEMIYFIMVDRFNNGDQMNDKNVNPDDPTGYNGGDLQGVTKRLDYIQKMGFTTIWLTPIVDNVEGGYHGYWPNDFYKVNEHFGSMKDMKELVTEAHKRKMKVVLDYVGNHTGYNHPWLQDPTKRDWFHEKSTINDRDPQSVEQGWLAGLPDLKQENPEVEKFLIDNAKWWVKETDVDGFRLDAVKHVSPSFWKQFTKEVRVVKPNFFFLGEVLSDNPKQIAQYENTGIDAFLNFPYQKEITDAFTQPNVSPERLYNEWKRDEALYKRPYLQGTFVDNHDLPRFSRIAKDKKQYPPTRLKLALAYLYTSPGIPIMYYGTEIALDGGKDPDNRRLMNFTTDEKFLAYITKLGELRKQLPALRRGTFEMLYDEGGMSVFKRTYKGEVVVTTINNTNENKTIHLTNEQLARNKELRGLLKEDLIRADEQGYTVVSNRETANVYVLAPKTGLNYTFIFTLVGIAAAFLFFLFLAKRKGEKK